jgi:hypothetical protein
MAALYFFIICGICFIVVMIVMVTLSTKEVRRCSFLYINVLKTPAIKEYRRNQQQI